MEMFMKYIIYGVGKIFSLNKDKIDMKDVIGFMDKSFNENDKLYMDKEIIRPDVIKMYEYDFIVVFSSTYFDEIAKMLIWNYKVHVEKIVSYLNLFDLNSIKYRKKLVRAIGKLYAVANRLLDIDAFIGKTQYCSKGCLNVLDCLILNRDYNLSANCTNLYNKIYNDIQELNYKKYDLIIINAVKVEECVKYLALLKNCKTWILFSVELKDVKRYKEIFDNNFNLLNIDGMLFGALYEPNNVKVYAVTHKLFQAPADNMYVPIYAGSYKGGLDMYLHDNIGDNISRYNDKINEATAMYWIWKNDHSDYVGINHYRRYFKSALNSNSYLQKTEILYLLNHYDIITANPFYCDDMNMKQFLCNDVHMKEFDFIFNCMTEIFEKSNPNDKQAFHFVFDGNMMFPCNMMIMKKELFNEYCSWLFPKVLEMIEKIEIKETWDNKRKRIIGFLTERLFTVWVVQQKYSIYEMPIKFIEE